MNDSTTYYNPYTGQEFFGFFVVLWQRCYAFCTGQLRLEAIVSDEIQVLVLIGIASSAALVGSFLVLRRMTMLANSLSHTILLGIVVAYILIQYGFLGDQEKVSYTNIKILLAASLIISFLTTFLTEFLTKVTRLQEDASTGLVFTTIFALGITLASLLTRYSHLGTEVVMGNVDALQLADCQLVFSILFFNILLILLFFKEFHITTFDPGLAKALGISPHLINYLLMAQVSYTAIAAFRAVGVLMVLAFITAPVLAARLLTHKLKTLIGLAIGLGCLASVIGVALSRHFLTRYDLALSTGGIVVCTLALLYALVILLSPRTSFILKYFQKRVIKKNLASPTK